MRIANVKYNTNHINLNCDNRQKSPPAFKGEILITNTEGVLFSDLIEHPAITSLLRRTKHMLPNVDILPHPRKSNAIILTYSQKFNPELVELINDCNRRAENGIGYLDFVFKFIKDSELSSVLKGLDIN